jgi:uncharacterized coiled-coil DUF342 family protein
VDREVKEQFDSVNEAIQNLRDSLDDDIQDLDARLRRQIDDIKYDLGRVRDDVSQEERDRERACSRLEDDVNKLDGDVRSGRYA